MKTNVVIAFGDKEIEAEMESECRPDIEMVIFKFSDAGIRIDLEEDDAIDLANSILDEAESQN